MTLKFSHHLFACAVAALMLGSASTASAQAAASSSAAPAAPAG